MKRFLNDTTWKFLLVGLINTLIGTGTMFFLYNLAHRSYWLSSAISYFLGGIVSFFLNKNFTFQNKQRSWQQVVKFILTVAVCYLIGYGLAKPLVMRVLQNQSQTIQENVAMLVGMCFYTGLNYLGQRFFAFRKEK